MYVGATMPLSAAERAKRRIQKLKDEGKYEEYKKKHRLAVTGISKCHIMYWQCGKLEKAQISQAFDKGVKEKPGY